MSTKSQLIEKQIISENSYLQLFMYLDSLHENRYKMNKLHGLQGLLRERLVGRLSTGFVKLTSLTKGYNKCWFINSGMVLGIQRHQNSQVVLIIFKAGQIAVLPNSFFYGYPPICSLFACADSHLLEITNEDVADAFQLFPEAKDLSIKITNLNTNNFLEKSEFAAYSGKEAIIEFHNRYPDTKGPDRKVKLLNTYQASYLGITETTFSKLLKQIQDDEQN